MTGADPYDLQRFIRAQDDGGTYAGALGELERGRKSGHWMWFVFPQLAGLGSSPTARFFAISSLDEARAYLAHPVLGSRLRAAAGAVLTAPAASPEALLGGIDAQKLRSSMTLFLRAAEAEAPGTHADEPFRRVLDRWYAGSPDAATDRLLAEVRRAERGARAAAP
jgi:uncharacterized protein (DUF1810 family)